MLVQSERVWFLTSLMVATEMLLGSGCGGDSLTVSRETGGASWFTGQTQVGQSSDTGGSAGKSTTSPSGGTIGATAAGIGGSLNAYGGSSSYLTSDTTVTGGTASSNINTSTGGATNTSGTTSVGGTTSTGGTMSTGGHVATGGHTATGGSFDGGTAPSWPKKFCGNITTQNKVDPPGLNYARHWDQITPENAGKWGSVQPGPSAAFNWATLDAIYAYAEQHNIPFKEHSFVWGAAQPAGTYTSATVENWIKSYCERYPKTSLIDVVNEPPPHTIPTYAKILGEGESGTYPWIVKAFKLARLHCGNAVLILNDYDNLAYASSQAHYIDIVNNVRANGGPIDALGIQAHDASKLTTSQLQASLDTLSAQTGLPIYITEYDISLSKDEEQLAIFQEQFPIFWQSKAVRGVTVWGWIMGYTWVSNSGLVRETTPRPAMTWLMNYLGRPSTP